MTTAKRPQLALLGSLVIMAGLAWSPRPTGAVTPAVVAPAGRPNIILITVDTLRADHLSGYGYPRLTTPALDRFAAGAVRFEQTIAQAPYTKASMASLMTGLYPSTHHTVTTSVPFPETMSGHVTTKPLTTDVLPASLPTLAESLRDAGYETIGFTTNPFLIGAFGFSRGFDQFKFYAGTEFAPAERLVADALDLVGHTSREKPLFLWLHLMEPHSPYGTASDAHEAFLTRGSPEAIPSSVDIPSWLLQGSPRDLRQYRAAYDARIAEADVAIDSLLRGMSALRARRPPVVVVTADHGEEFLDHGGWEHSRTLFDELVRVPLIIKAPGAAARVVHDQVQLIDLFPTLLELGGGTIPPNHGTSLVPMLNGAGAARDAMSEIVGSASALRTDGWKLIESAGRAPQLYHLSADPGEHQDVAPSHPELVERLSARLQSLRNTAAEAGRAVAPARRTVPHDERDRLRAIGYVNP